MAATAELSARLMQWLPDDPGLSTLRRATRAALVIPAAFACVKLVSGDAQVTTFVSFGCFALLVMADFGGLRRPRAAAYVSTTAIGAMLVTLGTLVSPNPWVAASLMLLVGFSIQFAGVFGSYVAGAQTALLLSFVLAVSVPASFGAAGPRLVGWLIAGTVATLSGVFFWPLFERLTLRRQAAAACRALARLIEAQHRTPENSEQVHPREEAQTAVAEVRRQYSETPKRPAGPARSDRAFVELLTELERAVEFAGNRVNADATRTRPCIEEDRRLTAAVVQTLERSASVLTGGPAPDLVALEDARVAHRSALDQWAAESLHANAAPEDILSGLNFDHALRVLSYFTLAIGTNAIIAAGGTVGDDTPIPVGTPLEGSIRPVLRIARTVRTHLTPSSSVLHGSLRVGIGLALAVLLARLLRLEHAFWVVLGTLTVLRSNAFGTGRSTVQAMMGTVAGFAVGALFTIVVGATSPVLWVALPIAVFLATYVSSAIGFMVGQAAFTVLLIILFNLISPVGWQVGLARVEDVAVGAAVSVVAGLLLWPRGAGGELGIAVARLYRGVAAFLAASFDRVMESGSTDSAVANRRLAIRARDRTHEAFEQFMIEGGRQPVDTETGASLIAAGTHAIMVGDLLNVVADMGYRTDSSSNGVAALRSQTQLVLAGFLGYADRLEGTTSALLSNARVSVDIVHSVALESLQHWRDDPDGARSAMAVIIAGEWIRQLGLLTSDLEAPVTRAIEGARTPWWRR